MPARIDVSVLGAVEVRRDGAVLDLGTPKQRALVAALALAHGWPVSVDAIVDHLWGEDAPPGVTGTLQAYVSQLRRVIEPDRAPRTPAAVLVTAAPGYALRVPDEQVDAHRFEQAVASAHKAVQPLGVWGPHDVAADLLERERAALEEALGWWRGTPYADLGDSEPAAAERTRLDGLRLVALEDRAVVALALGDHAPVAAELEALTTAHPLRERLWALRAVALARSGRQADALDVLREVRTVLDEQLGIEPSAELRELQTAVLRQDERLDWVAPAGGPPSTVVSPAAPARAPRRSEPTQVAPWPMVGRDADLAALVGVLADAEQGTPSFAVLTGEPGIGKSRLAAELLLQARRRGARVVVGRCTQDEGAPPLWPWKAVLEGLDVDLLDAVDSHGEDEGGQFRAWERICDAVRSAAGEGCVVVLLDDLHWADPSTLRVLRLLVESVTGERLLVIGTWREHPAPTGALADVAESLARAHAHRVALTGLPERDVGTIFEAITRREPGAEQTATLRQRTDGNPFFLVELARLAAERGGDVDLAEGRLPAAVGEVIDRRLARLPEQTVAALRVASVIGRRFDLPTLAAAARIDEDDALDVVEPAQAAGLVRDDGVDHFRFGHALVRDRLREGLSASRLARTHARVAEALAGAPGRESEIARHWAAAGPGHAGRAWRAALVAAGLAARLHDHDEAAAQLRAALDSQRDDPAATPEERFDVLVRLVDAYRWSARLPELVAAAEEAIAIGRGLKDPEAVARAAISASVDVLWRSAPVGETNPTVVSALEDSLEQLPEGDSELRCRVLLALALERQTVAPTAAIRPLVDDALATARRLEDPGLRIGACQVAYMTLWDPTTADERLGWITEAVELARASGNERAFVVGGTLRAAVLGELGQVAAMEEQLRTARAEADRLRIAYGAFVLTGLETSWRAMAGRFDDCERNLARMTELGSRLAHETVDGHIRLAWLALEYWRDRTAALAPALGALAAEDRRYAPIAGVFWWRAGEEERARACLADHGAPLDEVDVASPVLWAHAAELASYLGETGLADAAYERLLPLAGRAANIGAALVMAPVDAYLALAAAAAGRTTDAGRHADAALALSEAWGTKQVTAWLRELREQQGF